MPVWRNVVYWILIVLVLVAIGLLIWLLVRQHSEACPNKGSLDATCANDSDCNGGLVCYSALCKVATQGTCSSNNDCAYGDICTNNVCTVLLGKANDPCPCAEGFTCINNVCKAVIGQPCSNDGDCASGRCKNEICRASKHNDSECSDDYSSVCYSSYDDSEKTSGCGDPNCTDCDDSKDSSQTILTETDESKYYSSQDVYTESDDDCEEC